MGQQNGFGSGFVFGSIIGGVVGGLLGTALANRQDKQILEEDISPLKSDREISFGTEESIELARHGLENKIAQLNLAIDDLTQQLGTVPSDALEQD